MIRRWLIASLPFLFLVLSACPAGDDDPQPDARTSSGGVDARASTMACVGEASSCLSLEFDFQCRGQEGCEVVQEDECRGVARSCFGLFDSFSCSSQSGCFWSSISSSCSGSARSCSTMPGPASCGGQSGCSWQAFQCGGLARTCGAYETSFECIGQEGCDWK